MSLRRYVEAARSGVSSLVRRLRLSCHIQSSQASRLSRNYIAAQSTPRPTAKFQPGNTGSFDHRLFSSKAASVDLVWTNIGFPDKESEDTKIALQLFKQKFSLRGTVILWDYMNVSFGRQDLVSKINHMKNMVGDPNVSIFVIADFDDVGPRIVKMLRDNGCYFIWAAAGKNIADEWIRLIIEEWVEENALAPSTFVLASGDRGFRHAIRDLPTMHQSIVVGHPRKINKDLEKIAEERVNGKVVTTDKL